MGREAHYREPAASKTKAGFLTFDEDQWRVVPREGVYQKCLLLQGSRTPAPPQENTNQIGKNMTILRGTFVLLLLIPTLATSPAQQSTGKPVLSAQPAAKETAAPSPAVAPDTPMITRDYVIGANDSLQITVWKEQQLSGTFPVRPDGMITLPLIGDTMAAGFTPMQLTADITTRLKQFLTDPVVNVAVMAVNSKVVFFVGQVGRVGPLTLTPGMTILQAIASAGGLNDYANKKKIYILRGEQGKQVKIPFDYNKALKKDDMQGVSLVPGDTIVVP